MVLPGQEPQSPASSLSDEIGALGAYFMSLACNSTTVAEVGTLFGAHKKPDLVT